MFDVLAPTLSERDLAGMKAAAIGLAAASHTLASARNGSPLPGELAELATTLARVAAGDPELTGFTVHTDLTRTLASLDAEMAPGVRTWPSAQRRHAARARELLCDTIRYISTDEAA